MSSIIAIVKKIEECDNLHIVEFDFSGYILTMMSLELNDNIQIGTKVKLIVKPSNIAITKDFAGEVSFSNKLDATITSIDNGQLLSSVKLDVFNTTLESIITRQSVIKMDLNKGNKVEIFIKASEFIISDILY